MNDRSIEKRKINHGGGRIKNLNMGLLNTKNNDKLFMAVVGLCCVIVKVGVSQQYYINSKTATFILR